MPATPRAVIGLLAVIALTQSPALAEGGDGGEDLKILGITSNGRLIAFVAAQPSQSSVIGTLTGLSGDTTLVGIDFRPATGDLYGLGNAGGIYTIDRDTAVATFQVQMNVELSGTAFGIDFNPTVDRLRVISDTGQNLRVNVATGATIVDGLLNYLGPPPVTTLGVVGAAYTNNDADPNTATTLYCIDASLDQVVIQAPPNAGTLGATGKLTADAAAAVGFDIYSDLDSNGNTVDVLAFASINANGATRLYRINLFTGEASDLGKFKGSQPVVDIAIPLDE